MPEYEDQDVEYQIFWNEKDKYPYIHKTMDGVNETISELTDMLRDKYGIHFNLSPVQIKARVVIKQTSDWVENTNQFE
jgi:hypothetical protein